MPIYGAILSGVLLFLSFPKFGVGVFAWVALLPLLLALHGQSLHRRVILGLISGLIFHVGILYWVTYVIVKYGSLPVYLGIAAMLLLSMYLSLYTAVFATGTIVFGRVGTLIGVPLLWTVLEFFRGKLMTGFPWAALAYSQYLYRPMIQIVDITGISGLSFLIVLFNALLYEICVCKPLVRRLSLAAIAILIPIGLYVHGVWRIADVEKGMKQAPFFPVRLIQGNIDQNLKWDPQYQDETLRAYLSESSVPRPQIRTLVIWPETAAPFYFQEPSHNRRRILDFVREHGVWLILGSPSYHKEGRRMDFGNSAFLVSPEGVPIDRYDKVHLVPYGEYVPMRRFFPFIGRLAFGIGDFRSGPGFNPMNPDGHRIGILICYEGIFPEAAGAYKRSGAELLVNITNDAWFGPTSAPLQHLSMSLFRAVENRLYLCRAANTGISAFISPTGEILDRTPMFVRTHLSREIQYLGLKTFYSTYGDIFAYSCTALLCGILILKIPRRRK